MFILASATPFALWAHIVFAQERTFKTFVGTIILLIQGAIPLVMALALIMFLWHGVKLIMFAASDKDREDNKRALFWGIIALFVMVTLWGIVEIIKVTFL